MAGDPAAQLAAHLAEGEVDLVVQDDDAVERHASAPRAGPAASPDSFM